MLVQAKADLDFVWVYERITKQSSVGALSFICHLALHHIIVVSWKCVNVSFSRRSEGIPLSKIDF